MRRALPPTGPALWVVDKDKDKVFHYSKAGALLATFSVSPATHPEGIGVIGSAFWVVDKDTDRVYGFGAIPPPTFTPPLALDDNVYYALTSEVGVGGETLSYEVSTTVGFAKVEFGQVKIKLRARDENVKLQVFVFNDTDHGASGYDAVPDFSGRLCHDHDHDHDHGSDVHVAGDDASHDHPENDHAHHEDPAHDPAIDPDFNDKDDHREDHQHTAGDDEHVHLSECLGNVGHKHSHKHHNDHADPDFFDPDQPDFFGHRAQDPSLCLHDHGGKDDHDDDDGDHDDDHDYGHGHGHGGDHHYHHRCEETITFPLDPPDIAYINPGGVLKIKIVATEDPDPEHHHNHKVEHHHHTHTGTCTRTTKTSTSTTIIAAKTTTIRSTKTRTRPRTTYITTTTTTTTTTITTSTTATTPARSSGWTRSSSSSS